MPQHLEVSQRYAGELGAEYSREKQSDPTELGYRLNADVFLPHLRPTDELLDFGCGNGGMLLALKEHVASVRGLEVNPHSASIAREHGLEVFSEIEDLPAATFDVVTSNHVLEHVRDPSSTLERLRESMKPGARLLLKLPLEDFRAKQSRAFKGPDINHHLHGWTPRLISNTLQEAGFEVDDAHVMTWGWHPRLFRLIRTPARPLVMWLFAAVLRRRQLFAVGRNP